MFQILIRSAAWSSGLRHNRRCHMLGVEYMSLTSQGSADRRIGTPRPMISGPRPGLCIDILALGQDQPKPHSPIYNLDRHIPRAVLSRLRG
jgi:hypothetical protein